MDYDIQTLSPEPSSFSVHMCVGKGREGERGLKLRMTVIIITRKNHLKNKHYTHFSTDDVYKPMHVSSCTKIPLSLPPPLFLTCVFLLHSQQHLLTSAMPHYVN